MINWKCLMGQHDWSPPKQVIEEGKVRLVKRCWRCGKVVEYANAYK
jgi:hypothetical protein